MILGVCPQKNVLWNKLTVYEHLVIWNTLKGGVEDASSIDRLIEKCDLALKRNHQAKTLSGGMKRKLQLACMLIGGSSICLLDEVTSGLDPLSRRAIWNVILSERSHRTMILTTHFLDEAEVLSDHIVILSLGNTKCQGTPAQLKNEFGGGYQVSLPRTVDVSNLEYPVTTKDDQYICTVPDSKAAVKVLSSFRNLGNAQACITGPTIEDVFLRVSEKPVPEGAALGEQLTTSSSETAPLTDRQPASRVKSFFIQARALLIKRFIILRSQWWIYLFAIALPVVITYFLGSSLQHYETPRCSERIASDPWVTPFDLWPSLGGMAIGPQSANKTVFDFFVAKDQWYWDEWVEMPPVRNSLDSLLDTVKENSTILYSGGLWLPKNSAPTIIVPMDWNPPSLGMGLLNFANQMSSGVNITGGVAEMRSYRATEYYDSLFFIIIVCLMQSLYPAFFAIYPAYERRTQVRALQYSNGIRPAPLLAAYLLFDFIFVALIAVLSTVLMSFQAPFWNISYVFAVLLFYGLAATMLVYLISRMARSQPGAFVMSFLISGLMYAISIIGVTVSPSA
jgi:ABC-type multidrug transport system ATPase subunit